MKNYFRAIWADKSGMVWTAIIIAAWVLYGVFGCVTEPPTAPASPQITEADTARGLGTRLNTPVGEE